MACSNSCISAKKKLSQEEYKNVTLAQASFYRPRGWGGPTQALLGPGLPVHPPTTPGGRYFDPPRPKILPTPIQKVSKNFRRAPDPPTHPGTHPGLAFWPKLGKVVPGHPHTPLGVDLPLKRSLHWRFEWNAH